MNVSSSMLTVKQLYNLTNAQQESGFSYVVPRIYEDPLKSIKQRLKLQQKLQKPLKKVGIILKRGHYLDILLQQAAATPAPNSYHVQAKPMPKQEKVYKVNKSIKQVPDCKYPAPTDYQIVDSIQLSQKRMLKSLHRQQQSNFKQTIFQQVISRSLSTPGPGNYCPFIKRANTNVQIYKKKVYKPKKVQPESIKQQLYPYPVTYSLFGKMIDLPNKSKMRDTFGKSFRFNRIQKGSLKSPGPACYNIKREWASQTQGKRFEKSRSVFNIVSKKVSRSIYY